MRITGADKKSIRQASVLRHLQQYGYISIEDIATHFAVTTQTARRDIFDLEVAGKARRLHGGATLATTIDPRVYRQRRAENAAEKDRIGRKVAGLISNGSSVFIDTGTTCEAVARELLHHRDIRAVTYSLRVATMLSEATNFTVAVPGGFVRQVDGGVFRQETAEFISRFKFDFAVISVSGIDAEGDICDDDHAEVAAVQAAMQRATTVILAVDSSKFGRRGLVRLASLSDVDLLVCDRLPEGEVGAALMRCGVVAHVAAVAQTRPVVEGRLAG